MNETIEDIINRINKEQFGFITFHDASAIVGKTHGCADFNVLARTGMGREVIKVGDYIDFEKKIVAKGDYIRDFSVGFYVGDQKDQSWDKFCAEFAL